jgi:hypothetical protein
MKDRYTDWWPDADSRPWRPAHPDYAAYFLRYDPENATESAGAVFGAWRRIEFKDVRKYDILKAFAPYGTQIGQDGEPCASTEVLIAVADAEKDYEDGVGYHVTACQFFGDTVEPLTDDDRAIIDAVVTDDGDA